MRDRQPDMTFQPELRKRLVHGAIGVPSLSNQKMRKRRESFQCHPALETRMAFPRQTDEALLEEWLETKPLRWVWIDA